MEWSELVANHLHDMKNQLGVLMQQIDSSSRGEEKLELQRSSRQIHDNLIALLTLFRLEKGELVINRMDLPLCDVLQEAAGREDVLLDASSIRLETQCSRNAYGFYDRPLLVSVVSHGILNAIQAGASKIVLGASEQDGGALFTVNDNGGGLSEAPDKAKKRSATGVGLRLGEEIVSAHCRKGRCGEISLQPSESLGGTELSIWVP
ncbi:MAG: HAMP domain-containing histidine kinase [Gammaproteobacteria bacterium]|jgi:signal transduction histidine kinase|nr:HAMP domain-containing histidine kinase [Gammaproteobacteria bacterium]